MELRKIFKYRNVWIGVAMMWIVFVHSGFRFDSVFWMRLKEFGYGGVDNLLICIRYWLLLFIGKGSGYSAVFKASYQTVGSDLSVLYNTLAMVDKKAFWITDTCCHR